jgi:flagellar motility protein MotE (MotC chaperone)
MAKSTRIETLHDELEAVNREREAFEAEHRERARDAIAKPAQTKDGRVVTVYDPADLDADTLAILAHMGTPVPPLAEVFPDGVTLLAPVKG